MARRAPVVAASDLPVRGRIVIGEPCLVPWGRVASSPPVLALFGTIPTGLTFEPEEDNPQELIGNYFPGSPDGVSCPALPRPSFPSAVDIVRGAGEVKAFSRPVAIVEAQAERIGAF